MAQLYNASAIGASATLTSPAKPNDNKSTFALVLVNSPVAIDAAVDVSEDGTAFYPLMGGGANGGTLEESRVLTAFAGPAAFVVNVAGARYARLRIINTTAGASTVTAHLTFSPNRL